MAWILGIVDIYDFDEIFDFPKNRFFDFLIFVKTFFDFFDFSIFRKSGKTAIFALYEDETGPSLGAIPYHPIPGL